MPHRPTATQRKNEKLLRPPLLPPPPAPLSSQCPRLARGIVTLAASNGGRNYFRWREAGRILKPGGIIHLKTDNDMLFAYTLDVIREGGHEILFSTPDLYHNPDHEEVADVVAVQTHYEKMWLEQGLTIKYLRFRLNEIAQ